MPKLTQAECALRRVNEAVGRLYRKGDCEIRGGQKMVFSHYIVRGHVSEKLYRESWLKEDAFARMRVTARATSKRLQTGATRTINCIAAQLLASAKKRAVKSGGTVTIDKKWVLQRLHAGKCEFTGAAFEFPASGVGNLHNRTPSLDRIDSADKNYSPENTRVVCVQVNFARGMWRDEVSLPLLRQLVDAMEKSVNTKI